jgi:iron complex outermembrane receptor protein
MVNLSESLARVPGIIAPNRQNHAQDLQVSSRGFGARGIRRARRAAITAPAGARLPGVPATSAYGELAWMPGGVGGLQAAIGISLVDRIFINDRNSDAAPRCTVANARIGLEQQIASVTLREFVRSNNLSDRKYVGSVIVGDTNGRSFESAPGRNWSAGIAAVATF